MMRWLEDSDEIVVAKSEYSKLRKLYDTIHLVDAAHRDFRESFEREALEQGVKVEFTFDWRMVVRSCAPEVLVVLAEDPTREKFQPFPIYAVLPVSGQYISLTEWAPISIEDDDEAASAGEVDASGALNRLITHAKSLDGGKRENAMKMLFTLQRILK
jgi:hypothetical protein